jgi:hypothetical protein
MCESGRMRLVRVRNRLRKGTRDVVLVVRYRGVLCEIQLALSQTRS